MKVVKDKHGNEIREGDVIKVFHFTGARNKKSYMYKLVTILNGELFGLHLGSELLKSENPQWHGYFLTWHGHDKLEPEPDVEDIEIVEAGTYDPDRKLKGPAA